jgi:hypothetical protein
MHKLSTRSLLASLPILPAPVRHLFHSSGNEVHNSAVFFPDFSR